MRYLGQAGLADLPAELNAAKISRFQLSTIGGTIKINLPLGFALSREALDNGIVQRAITAGAVFLPSTSAAVGPCQAGNEGLREVGLATASGDVKVYASCVLVADGLNGRALADLHEPENMLLATEVATASRIGAGTIVAPSAALDRHYQSGSIYMALDRGGYVGLVRLEGGRLDLAAAFDPVFTREMGSPQSAAKEILQRVGLPYLPDFDQGHWAGTAPLTRQRRALAAKRLFVIGDAACYGEPFTGEGMAWACAGALLVVPLAMQACQRWDDSMTSQWQTEHKKLIGNKQIISRRLGRLLRNEKFARVALGGVLKHLPVLAKPIVDRVCR
jgi:flavin-dependent dehydrogenase